MGIDSILEDVQSSAAELSSEPDVSNAPDVQADTSAPDVSTDDSATEKPAETEKSAAARARDEAGRFAKAAKEAKEAKAKAEGKEPEGEKEAVPAEVKEGEEAQKTETKPVTPPARKPPQSWKPTAREKWGALPPEVQEEVERVDKEVRQTMQNSAEARRVVENLAKTIEPYRPLMGSAPPLQVIGSLMQANATLMTGQPAQKAQMVANIIRNYGVSIDELAAAIDGQAGQQGQARGQPGPEAFRDPRLDSILANMERTKAQRAQTEQQRVQQELASFSESHEFFEDVRDSMADLVEHSQRRGVALTWEDAYNRAVQLERADPKSELGGILRQREAAAAAKASLASTQRARTAAASVRTEPASVTAPKKGGSVLDDVREAAASLGRR